MLHLIAYRGSFFINIFLFVLVIWWYDFFFTVCIFSNIPDVNECERNQNLCKPGGFCQNIKGEYRCDCIPPYMRSKDGRFCEGELI